jgi:diaminobutyrate-2-oxoglutarate transaminase
LTRRVLSARATQPALELPCIGEVRGLGLMLGIELIDPATGAAGRERARVARTECFARGLLCELGGRNDATLRLLPCFP